MSANRHATPLELADFPVDDLRFGEKLRYAGRRLEVDEAELVEIASRDRRILSARLDIVRPGERVRVTGIRDVVEPRVKVDGTGQVFPGITNPVVPVGAGRTHRLSGMTLITTAEYEGTIRTGTTAQRSAILDMWGPGAELTGFSRLPGLVLTFRLPPDLIEAFTFGRFDLPQTPYYTAHRESWFEPNIWPTRPPAFQPRLCAYYRAMERLAATLMRIFALALGMPEAFFDDKIDRHITAMRLNHYAEAERPPLPGQLRAGAHTDYGSLTVLLATDAAGGLQVRGSDGAWWDVEPLPGTFIVNLGDLMAQWTNDRWVSTLHRVVNPPSGRRQGSRRASIAFFHQPNHDAAVECLPTCRRPGDPPRHAPTTSGAHLLAKTAKETGAAAPGA